MQKINGIFFSICSFVTEDMIEETTITVVGRKRSRRQLLEIPVYDAIETADTRKRSRQQLLQIKDYDAIATEKPIEKNDKATKEEEKENTPKVSTNVIQQSQIVSTNMIQQSQSTTKAVANMAHKILGEKNENSSASSVDVSDILIGQRNVIYASLLDSLNPNQTDV